MAFLTPLRYPGGKGRLANYIKLIIQQNDLFDAPYIEPYAGGSGVALALLFDEYVSHIHINDLSIPLYAFWHSLLNETDTLCELILTTPINMDEWQHQHDIQNKVGQISLIDLGFSTFFLNRTNRSGILTGGVIGGKNQDGPDKLDARFNRQDLIRRIKQIARFRSRISIYNQDASDFIQNTVSVLPTNSFIYLDPPYYKKGQCLYENFYSYKDHKKISELVATLNQSWLVTYDNSPAILEMYKTFRRIEYKLSYSAGDRYQGTEIMFFSNGLVIPPEKIPINISSHRINQLSFLM